MTAPHDDDSFEPAAPVWGSQVEQLIRTVPPHLRPTARAVIAEYARNPFTRHFSVDQLAEYVTSKGFAATLLERYGREHADRE